eukprot:comp20724_c0_seq1/m.27080 comp20724_c0_seq1/g.27080  ORF comp20724_c0_seq1/g.27080 comp20724_c0_seq1/m.27080 type:complete len:294 (-) comp20724_c0_seq1:746-1627(-)
MKMHIPISLAAIGFLSFCLVQITAAAATATTCAAFFGEKGGWEVACGCGKHPVNNAKRLTCTAEACESTCCVADNYDTCASWKDNLGLCAPDATHLPSLESITCQSVCRCNATTCCTGSSSTGSLVPTAKPEPSTATKPATCATWITANGGSLSACPCNQSPVNNAKADCPPEGCSSAVCCKQETFVTCQDWVDNLGTCSEGDVVLRNAKTVACTSMCRCNATTCCERGTPITFASSILASQTSATATSAPATTAGAVAGQSAVKASAGCWVAASRVHTVLGVMVVLVANWFY